MATKLKIESFVCADGQHQARRVPIRATSGEIETTCKVCGCVLKRTLATRRWYYSGPLS